MQGALRRASKPGTVSAIAYTGAFALLALLVKRSVTGCLLYWLVWEALLTSVLDPAEYLSARAFGGSILHAGLGLEAIGEADDKGMRTVMTILNGQLRPVFVRDRSITVDTKSAEKADASKPGQIAAPFSGVVVIITTCAPSALANFTPMWPRPPRPMIATLLPGPTFQWRSGLNSVIPAHSSGAAAA